MSDVKFTRDVNNRVICKNEHGGSIASQTVQANLLLAILEKLTEISETNKSILGEVDGIQPPS